MHIALRPATPADVPAMTEIYFSAFSKDLISLHCFPRNNPAVYKFWLDSNYEELKDPSAHYLVAYDSSAPTSTSDPTPLIAYAKWVGPSAFVADALPTWPAGGDATLADHFFQTLVNTHARVMGQRKHWYLEILATRPEFQGKGAGSALMRWGLARADEDRLETYIEASPEGKPIYEHFGFAEVDRLVVLNGEFTEVMMLRPGKGEGTGV